MEKLPTPALKQTFPFAFIRVLCTGDLLLGAEQSTRVCSIALIFTLLVLNDQFERACYPRWIGNVRIDRLVTAFGGD
jgi:hypothetical protein